MSKFAVWSLQLVAGMVEFLLPGSDTAFCSWLFLIDGQFGSFCALMSEGAALLQAQLFLAAFLSSKKKLQAFISVWR